MPCNSDHMEPTVKERQHRRVAQHLLYIADARDEDPDPQTVKDAANIYGGSNGEAQMALLCSILRRMDADEMERIVYDAYNAEARALASWWEEHQEQDRIADEKTKGIQSMFEKELTERAYSFVGEMLYRAEEAAESTPVGIEILTRWVGDVQKLGLKYKDQITQEQMTAISTPIMERIQSVGEIV